MIELKQIETSGNQALCGYYSMANYIMTLPYNLRIKFYEELLKKLNENSPASIVGLKKNLQNYLFQSNLKLLKIIFQRTLKNLRVLREIQGFYYLNLEKKL